jgi:hypothetical protein
VVVAILAILMSLLSPALRHSLSVTRTIGCANNLKGMYAVALIYTEDYDDRLAASGSANVPYVDFITKTDPNLYGGIYPGNSTFMTFMQGYKKVLPIDYWTGPISDGTVTTDPDPLFDCPAGTGKGMYYNITLEEKRIGDKRFVNYSNIPNVWTYINKRDERYPDPVEPSAAWKAYGGCMALPMTDVNYASQTILFADSVYYAAATMNEMSSSGILQNVNDDNDATSNLNQIAWYGSPGGQAYGVRVEHEGGYQFIHFDGSVGLMYFPEVHDSFRISWLMGH